MTSDGPVFLVEGRKAIVEPTVASYRSGAHKDAPPRTLPETFKLAEVTGTTTVEKLRDEVWKGVAAGRMHVPSADRNGYVGFRVIPFSQDEWPEWLSLAMDPTKKPEEFVLPIVKSEK